MGIFRKSEDRCTLHDIWNKIEMIDLFSCDDTLVCGRNVWKRLTEMDTAIMSVVFKDEGILRPKYVGMLNIGRNWVISNLIGDNAIIPLSKFKQMLKEEMKRLE